MRTDLIVLSTHTQEIINGIQQRAEESSGDYDYISFYEGLNSITSIANSILGILVVLIDILIPIIISLELCYINFPMFRQQVDKIIVNSGGAAHGAFEFTFKDAVEAVRKASIDGAGNSNLVYFKKKCKSIWIVVFIISIALTGNMQFLRIIGKVVIPLIQKLLEMLGIY